jgi:mRNA interferase YafQ
MRTIERSTQFKKDYKKYSKSVYGSELDVRLKEVIGHLLADQPLPIKFRDHQLRANWKGYRDCHVFPDLVLIYQLQDAEVLRLVRLGSHSELSL